MSIKAVIFDFGNVISVTQPNTCFYDMADLTGIPHEIFFKAMGPQRSDFDLGVISAAELYSRVLKGYKLGVLSNMPYEFLERYKQDIPPFVKADYAVFSCNVHIIKPDARIYKLELDGLGVKPEEAVFFDDLQKNIDAAKALGINGILWENFNQAKAEFEKLVK